jgi:hypothetical protein
MTHPPRRRESRSRISSRKRGKKPRPIQKPHNKKPLTNKKKPHRKIGDRRLERGLGALSQTNDIRQAARASGTSVEAFKRKAKRKRAIRKIGGRWVVARRLQRRMPIFTDGRRDPRRLLVATCRQSANFSKRTIPNTSLNSRAVASRTLKVEPINSRLIPMPCIDCPPQVMSPSRTFIAS